MSFQIRSLSFGQTSEYQLLNTDTGEFCCIVPSWGAVMRELSLVANGQLYSLIDCPNTHQDLTADTHYLSAILFPFPSRIPNGRFRFEGKTYQLPINEPARGNAIHGFVHPNAFEVVAQEVAPDAASLTLVHDYNGHIEGYPFPFQLFITYRLSAGCLSLTYKIHNTGQQNMPCAFGWHPYFKLGDGTADDFEIEIPSSTIVSFDEAMIPTGRAAFEQNGRFSLKEKVLDNAFIIDTERHETNLFYPLKKIQLTVFQDIEKLKYLVIYTPPHRKTIAIEPLSSNVNALNTGEGLMVIAPNQTTSGTMGIRLS